MDIADTRKPLGAAATVAALYAEHALGLVRLAVVMTGDRAAAEDIVQDAFLGLYRRWQALHDADKALGYLRSSVLNGCRSVHRVRFRRQAVVLDPPGEADSAEAEALLGEAHRRATGEALQTFMSGAYLDARVYALYDKIPTLCYGPSGKDIHGNDERVSLKSFKRITTAMALFVAGWCGVEPIDG